MRSQILLWGGSIFNPHGVESTLELLQQRQILKIQGSVRLTLRLLERTARLDTNVSVFRFC